MGRPPLLQHLWSLAVEEQFYLVWPVLLVLGLRAAGKRWRWLSLAVLLAAVASAVGMGVAAHSGIDASRAYYGTDTRAGGLLMGSFLGFWWSATRLRVPPRRIGQWLIAAIGGAGLAYLLWAVVNINQYNIHLYRGGFLLVDLAACLTIAAAVHPGSPFGPRWLGVRPLRWVGLRSYGIYLWHWPIFMLTRPHLDIALAGVPLLVLRLALTLLAADVSYRFVEQPIRARGTQAKSRRIERRFPALAPAALAACGLVIAGVLVLPSSAPASPISLASSTPVVHPASPNSPSPSVLTSAAPTSAAPTRAVPKTSSVADTASHSASAGLTTTAPRRAAPNPPAVAASLSPPPRVTAVGDSVMLDASAALTQQVQGISVDANVGRLFSAGLTDLRNLQNAGRLGQEVVVHLGTNGMITSAQFDQLLTLLRGVRRVVIVNVRVPRPWEGPVNDVLAAGVKRWPNAVLVDWHGAAGAQPDIFWNDGIHLRPQGAVLYAHLVAAAL